MTIEFENDDIDDTTTNLPLQHKTPRYQISCVDSAYALMPCLVAYSRSPSQRASPVLDLRQECLSMHSGNAKMFARKIIHDNSLLIY